MHLLIVSDAGDSSQIDVGDDMTLQDVSALLEAETGIPPSAQTLLHNGNELKGATKTLKEFGIQNDDMILLRSSAPAPSSSQASSSQAPQLQNPSNDEAEQMRLQLLGNPELMSRLKQAFPELAMAAEKDPARFKQLLPQLQRMQDDAAAQRQRSIATLNADPFDVEAQKQIEEAIRQEAILENMEHAMEYSPESFGRVTMLYIPTEVNGYSIKAFVDSGAQATIMSPETAEKCGLMRLLDRRFAGIARGVGTAKILGRVHSAQIRLGPDLYLACAFTIMEGKGVDLLFGLDMLKRHQAIIDLEKDELVIQGRRVRFLPEHELPDSAKNEEVEVDENGEVKVPKASSASATSTGALGAAAAANTASKGPTSTSFTPFAGSGNSLNSAPSSAPSSAQSPAQAQSSESHPEASIQSLIGLGVSRVEAVRLLDSANGNADLAASLLFSSFGE